MTDNNTAEKVETPVVEIAEETTATEVAPVVEVAETEVKKEDTVT